MCHLLATFSEMSSVGNIEDLIATRLELDVQSPLIPPILASLKSIGITRSVHLKKYAVTDLVQAGILEGDARCILDVQVSGTQAVARGAAYGAGPASRRTE
jgi:hypothetical protein